MSKYVCVFNSFDQKEQLKERGYHWHGDSKSWVKKFENSEVEDEINELLSLDIDRDYIKDIKESALEKLKPLPRKKKSFPTVDPGEHCVLIKNCFDVKDKLKADGYHWQGEQKIWFKDFDSEEDASAEKERLSEYEISEENIEVR